MAVHDSVKGGTRLLLQKPLQARCASSGVSADLPVPAVGLLHRPFQPAVRPELARQRVGAGSTWVLGCHRGSVIKASDQDVPLRRSNVHALRWWRYGTSQRRTPSCWSTSR